jgi:YfiH family protein
MPLISETDTPFFEFAHLARCSGLRHAIFTRKGGHSVAPFDSLNVSGSVGDSETQVDANRRLLAKSLGFSDIRFVHQVHGTDVVCFSRNRDTGAKALSIKADAMISDIPGTVLAVQVADCQPVLLFDPIGRVAGVVHSGWRGSIGNILGKTVAHMANRFNCAPSDILAGIGPSLGPCCAEFVNYRREIPESFWQYRQGADHFDFWAASTDQLADAGVLRQNIVVSGWCTKCRSDLFFSYRAKPVTGRFAAAIGLTGP